MSIERESPSPSPRAPARRPTQQVLRQSVSTASLKTTKRGASNSRSRQRSSSYTVFRRDILYRCINEYQLPGSMLSAYTDLLGQLGFDLSPLVANGQTWFLCCGKREDRSPCRRMVPEMYIRTSIGQVLQAAGNPQLFGDALVADLATALSFAICSEHHEIHKVVRATECQAVIRQWRRDRISSGTVSTPTKRNSPSPATVSRSGPGSGPSGNREQTLVDDENEDEIDDSAVHEGDMPACSRASDKHEVERKYQEYLRTGRRSPSSASSSGSGRATPAV